MNGLKWIAFSMALMLGGAAALVVGIMTDRIGPSACWTGGTLDLSAEGKPSATSWDGKLLRLTIPKEGGATLLMTIDTCKGRVLSRMTVKTAS